MPAKRTHAYVCTWPVWARRTDEPTRIVSDPTPLTVPSTGTVEVDSARLLIDTLTNFNSATGLLSGGTYISKAPGVLVQGGGLHRLIDVHA